MTGHHHLNEARMPSFRPALRLLLLSGVAFCLVFTGVPLPTDWPHGGFPISAALADDDDGANENDGGGDRDSGGGGAGGSGGDDDDGDDLIGGGAEERGSKVVPAQARDGNSTAREILAIDADAATIASLEAAGFVARERRDLPSLGVSINRLTIPTTLSLTAALQRARQVAPKVSYEANPVYRIADNGQEIGRTENTRCQGSDCYSFDLVGWPNNPEYRGDGVVAAAGNGGPAAAPAFPAAYDSVVSVTAIGQDRRAYRLANRGDYIAFASPGVGIWSAAEGGGGRYRTGTSVAAVLVSAIIAEIIGNGDADLGRAVTTPRRDALDLGAPGWDPVFGWGLIQASPICRG